MSTYNPSGTPTATAAGDYAYRMQVGALPQQVIAAVTDGAQICDWWTAATRSERHGDTVRLWMGDTLLVDFTLRTDPAGDKVAWDVTGCVESTWIGTTPTFTVRAGADGGSAVEFVHVGLRPELECFDMCRAGWNHFMPSLEQYLETGVGRPNEPRQPVA